MIQIYLEIKYKLNIKHTPQTNQTHKIYGNANETYTREEEKEKKKQQTLSLEMT